MVRMSARKASFELADGEPPHLLGGSNLQHLLHEHAGLEPMTEPPHGLVAPVGP